MHLFEKFTGAGQFRFGQASRDRQVTTAMALAVVPGGNDRKESADGKRDSLRFWCGH